jgi:hypothetical protein
MIVHVGRLARLSELADECQEVYDEDTRDALDTGKVPRYALLTSEGSPESSYRDNPNLTVHRTRGAMARAAAAELDGGWCPLQMVDLDTGAELGWTIKVTVS